MFKIILLLFSSSLYASSITLNIGQTETVFNRFAIPNSDQNRISLPTDESLTSYRLTGNFDLSNGNQIYVLLAPLETTYQFRSDKNFEFDDENFIAGETTKVNYKFNSYRIGYLWKWDQSLFDFWVGAVAKIRDAEIEVSQNSSSKSFSNIGFVPLAAFGFDYLFFKNISIFSHTDALGASQGSAYDSQIELKWNGENMAASFGKRILGGGADNDSVYNFAQFDTYYLGLTYKY